MANNDSEQTPLLHDHDNRQAHRSHHIADNIRNALGDDQVTDGRHATPPSSPKKIHTILPRLFGLINALVDSASVEDDIITDDVVEFLNSYGKEVVYGLLRCVETYIEAAKHDVGRKKLLERRAVVAQMAAVAVTKIFVDKNLMGTYCHVLTRPYFADGEEPSTSENAIEIAIRVHATDFLANIDVQRCVQALWNGLLLQTEDDECRIRFVEYSGVRRSRKLWEWVDVGRLNVPRYQNNMKIAMFILFLTMYTIVVNDRGDYPSILEWTVYVFVCGYIFEEFRLIFEGGTSFFLGSIWHWINIISYSMFLVCFAFRFTAVFFVTNKETFERYNNIAYDVLALLAVFLWIKTVSLLDGIQYFGTMVMVLQKMLKDGIMFFWLLAWVFIGFLQSFYALQPDHEKDFNKANMLLVRGFLQDPDWDLAHEIDNTYGNWIFALYLFLTSIILLNLLIALFNSSYTNITDSSEKEYLALFTFKVFSYLRSPDQYPYAAPFNLVEVFFVIPWSVVLSRKSYSKLNRVIMGIFFWIPVLIIARSERKRYWKLKNTNKENDFEGGRRLYRHHAEGDTHFDDLYLKATREHDDHPIEGAEARTTAATVAQEEEGVLAASTDLWMSSLSALDSFEEFKEQRNRTKGTKAQNKQALSPSGSMSAAPLGDHVDVDASGSGSREQLTDILPQTLVASLAKMEARQKEMEALLKAFVEENRQSKIIAQVKGAGP
ncbi:hypothetical protein BGZ65_001136 [Modicella reniformis]|uniref:Ion transport domain-containing protein n=1 Tax=Modicella reniformis TaxID=1440133 RepID=A0A9P6J495_9FUNG|nr:hypothetical protein BGZ65_001136 [Modicella reniformis]